jgi:predicted AlkP superfamily phosphohydrolase/phosphomutase
MKNRILIIGLDGGTFTLLKPWMDAGFLPTLKKMTEEGGSGFLQSSVPPITVTAWSSFMTGKNPAKHGLFEFFIKKPNSYGEIPINASMRDGKAVWDILGDNGSNVLVLNVPTTYPPQPVNGVLISGFLTPSGKRDFVYPSSLVDEIEGRFGPYPLYIKTPAAMVSQMDECIDRLLEECTAMLAYKTKVAQFLMDKLDSDFTMLHIWGTDRIQHELWDLLDPHHPRYNKERAEKYGPKIIAYYRHVDTEIGRLMEKAGDEATTFVISDHGFLPIYKLIDLNVWLLREGYLTIKGGLFSRIKFLLWRAGLTYESLYRYLFSRLRRFQRKGEAKAPVDYAKLYPLLQKIFLSMNDIDWQRTRAYCKFGMGQIVINLRGREPEGIVEQGSEYEDLRQEIMEKLKGMTDPDTGKEINGQVFLKEEVYQGKYFDHAPDIVYLGGDSNYLATNLFGFTSNRVICDNIAMPGSHSMHGILLTKGRHIRKGIEIQAANIVDLAPTILYLKGNKIPEDMDGRVLKEIISEEFLSENEIAYTSEEETASPKEGLPGISEEDEKEVKKRLKELGYIG